MDPFDFPAADRFLDRSDDLARLEDWWSGNEANALALYGRRRVGKSWLFRCFAHGKPAIVLVADRRATGPQLDRFATQLEPLVGFRPALDDVASLVRILYTIARDTRTLAIVDEFPYLLPTHDAERDAVLTSIQRVMEERDDSSLKLVLCGSYIGQMEKLMRGPLRGRLTPMAVEPLSFAEARAFMAPGASATDAIGRFGVAGGMALYLDELARHATLRERVCARVLDPRGPLFNDPREVLDEELRTPGTYYSLLEELATGSRSIGDLATALGRRTTDLQGYLRTLIGMRIVRRVAPVTAGARERSNRYVLADDFLRFWFRFVFPFQEDLRTGVDARALYDDEIAPALNDHLSPAFEELCRIWARRMGRATTVGAWWGNALNEHRKTGVRFTEEVDVVGLRRSVATLIGECKWTNARVGAGVLADLETHKIPAMRQAGVRFAKGGPRIALFAKSGFDHSLRALAEERADLELVDADTIVRDLLDA